MNRYKYFKPLVVALLMFTSCNDDILYKTNPSQLAQDNFFQTRAQVEAGVNAIYAGLQANQLYNREYFFLHDMLSDDVESGGGQLEAHRARVLNHQIDPSNSVVTSVWDGMYRLIHRSNLVINAMPDVPAIALTQEEKNRYEGEARFLRAFAYFDLVSLWGDIPLMTEPATAVVGVERASQDLIYNLIFEDLAFAATHLPTRSQYQAQDMGRATKGAAQGLAARARLFRGQYAEARPLLEAIIASGEYALVPRYLDNFQAENENNEESLFEVQFTESQGDADAWNADGRGIAEITFRGQEYGFTDWRNLNPHPSLFAAYDPADPRRGYNFYQNGDTYNNGESVINNPNFGIAWKKYQNNYKRDAELMRSGINFRVIRYADVLLMMAEVLNELDGPAAAVPFVNQVRARADVNMPAIDVPASKDAMHEIIMLERRLEMPGEQIRNRDLRRWRRMGKLTGEPLGSKFQPFHDLLPLPINEIDRNAALTSANQNPGY